MKERAKILRRNQTIAESKLWFFLRRRNFFKDKFRRQHVIGPYIVDFVCLKKRLIIEIDGSQHVDNQDYDERRTLYLKKQGFHVLRFWNNQVLKEVDAVLDLIHEALSNNPSSPLRGPSPQ